MELLILGCGFTGERVAQQFTARDIRVTATTRDLRRLEGLPVEAVRWEAHETERLAELIDRATHVLHSLPVPFAIPENTRRWVYLSTTGVYGDVEEVDEHTVPAPNSPRGWSRLETERGVAAASANSLILRPAAIYGPGRGAHVAIRQRRFLLPAERRYTSRIHVADLAAITAAALDSELCGAWPVADDRPCTAQEIAEYCSRLLGVPMPGEAPVAELSETRQANRRVDGSGIRRALGVGLLYPTYREGIPASIREEEP